MVKGRLIAGIGGILWVYELGQHKFLWKCENRGFVSSINRIEVEEDWIFICDRADSLHVLSYKVEDALLYEFADDPIWRYIHTFTMLDQETAICSDLFENVFVLRLPPGYEENGEDDPTATWFWWE